MRQIFAIASFTFKKNISNKAFRGFLIFAVLAILGIAIVKNLALYGQSDVIIGIGQYIIELFIFLIVLFTASGQYIRDKKEKSIYLILTKPVSRSQYIIGNVIGLIEMIIFDVIVMGLILTLVLYVLKAHIGQMYYISYLFIIFKLSIIVSIGVLFSVISESFTTANIFTICIYFVAQGAYELHNMAKISHQFILKFIFNALYYILPNFYALNYKDALKPLASYHVFIMFLYTLGYIIVIVVITNLIFMKKEL